MAIDWFSDPLSWTGYLRAQRFPLTVGDELRVMRLLDELRGLNIALPDTAAATRWLAPVLCRDFDQQARLATLLSGFAAIVEQTPQAPVPPSTPQVEKALRPARYWWLLTGFVVILLLILTTTPLWTGLLVTWTKPTQS